MPHEPHEQSLSAEAGEDLREICQTMAGLPAPSDAFADRLQYVADLLEQSGCSLKGPHLLWREAGQGVRTLALSCELVLGRETQLPGLSLAADKLLSRRHFALRPTDGRWLLDDLGARNGTAVNRADNRVRQHLLCDGDVIYAGNQVFVYVDSAREETTPR